VLANREGGVEKKPAYIVRDYQAPPENDAVMLLVLAAVILALSAVFLKVGQ
jgi:hypothetical protein